MAPKSPDSASAQEKHTLSYMKIFFAPTPRSSAKKLQPEREAVEGDCSICHGAMTPGMRELTFCNSSCGGNFHSDCIEDWKKEAARGQVAKCPLCRVVWASHPDSQVKKFPKMKAVAFEIYAEWLYKGYIADCRDLEGDTEDYEEDDDEKFWDDLTKAYSLGLEVEDDAFCDSIIEAIIEAFETGLPWYGEKCANEIYDNTPGPCRLRELIVALYINEDVNTELTTSSMEWESMNQEFLRDLLVQLVREKGTRNATWDVNRIKTRMGLNEADNSEQSAN